MKAHNGEHDMWRDDKEEQQAYIDALNALSNEPQVEVGKEREVPFRKPNNDVGVIADAQRQTQADVDNFIANRYLGDQRMKDYAMENGDNIYYGGPSSAQTPFPNSDRFFRNNIEDSYAPAGYNMQIPNQVTNAINPEFIQRQMDSDRQEMEDLKQMEAKELLRGLRAYGL